MSDSDIQYNSEQFTVHCTCAQPTVAYLLPYLLNLTTFAYAVHRFFYCVIDCTFVFPMCNSVVFVTLLCFILARSQLKMRTYSQLVYLVK
jgi:hypothetical protein